MEDPGHDAGESVSHSIEGHTTGRQVHPQTHRDPGGGPGADASFVGHGHHRHSGSKAAHRQVSQQGELGQGEQQAARQQQQTDGLPWSEPLLLPLFGPGGKGDAVKVDRGAAQQQLRAEEDKGLLGPALIGQINKPGDTVNGGGGQRHEPALPIGPHIKKGKGHRKNQHAGRHIPQALHKALHGEIAKAGPQQGTQSVQPRAGGPHHSQPKGGIAAEDLRPRQQGPQQEADDTLGGAHQCRSPEHHLPCLPGLFPQAGRLGFQRFFCRHGPCLLCSRGLSARGIKDSIDHILGKLGRNA